MNRSLFLRTSIGAAIVGACALVASHARAFSLKVTPIPIVITGGATSTMVELENQGQEPLRVQASAFDWTQTATGEDKLDPSNEVLLFPSMITVAPGGTRKVRIGTQGGYGPKEKAFRVIFGELPPNSSPVEGQAEMVKVVSRVSVPIFVTPPGAVAVLKVEGVSATKDHVHLAVHNTGGAHALVEKVRLEFRGDGGRVLSSTDVAGWYVLPDQTRGFDVALGKDLSCAGAKELLITATSRESGAASAVIQRPACAN